jgi:hypothetical protein
MPGLGHVTKAQIFLESTAAYGTRVTTTGSALEVNVVGVNIDQGVVASKALYNGLSARALYQMGIKWTGKISGEVRYEGLMKLIACAFGAVPSSSGSAGTGYTHVNTVQKLSGGGVQSICMEIDEAGVYDASGDCSLISGIVIPRLKFSVAAGQGDDAILMFEADVLAKDKAAATTASYTAGVPAALVVPVFYHQGVVADLKDGTADTPGSQNVTKLSVELTNPLAERYFIASANGKNIAQPLRNGQVSVFWDLTQEFQNFNQFKAAKAFTDGELKASFLGDVIPAASGNYKLTLNSTKAKCIDYKNDIGEWGVIEATSRWQAYNDTNGPLIATLINGKATASTLGA